MASNSEDGCVNSPSHIAMTGHEFSAEDIQALLGGVLESNSDDVGQDGGSASASNPMENNDARALARTERKRRLEKQRRSDVNKQFSELQVVLRRIESEDPEEVRGLPAYSPANRVDLIARTISLLNNLHNSNKRRKTQVVDLEKQLENAKKAGEEAAAKLKESMMAPQSMGNNKVMMMVPMLIGGGENGAAMPMMNPWMPPGSFMPMPMAPAPSSQSHQQGPPSAASAEANARNAVAANMQAQWMMQQSWPMSSMPMMSASSQDNQKSSSSDQKKELGGNLAHCA